jgi:hypothetical protein
MRTNFIVAICLVFSSWSVIAAEVEGLYEAEVLVADQGSTSRTQAMSTALAEVFAKVSGRPNIVSIPAVAAAISKPSVYVEQYLYKKPPKSGVNNATQPSGQLLWIQFGENAVNAILRKSDIAVWGKTRPATLVWLAVEEQGGRYILGGESLADLQAILQKESKRCGVKLIVPLLDLQDQMALKFADIWGNFQDAIFNASERYQADAILVGKASVSATNEWSVHWVLYENEQSTNWGSQSIDVADLLNSGVLGTLEVLASRFTKLYASTATEGAGAVMLTIEDVNSLDNFARVSSYLISLEQITKLIPVGVATNMVSYEIELRGSIEGLARTISLGNTIRKVVATAPDATLDTAQGNAVEYRYRLLP